MMKRSNNCTLSTNGACERDGRDGSSTWLGENDIEIDSGHEPALEQPTEIRPRKLDPGNPNDLARLVFGLTSDDDLPPINAKSLRRYHQYLSERLPFPFPAIDLLCVQPGVKPQPVRVQALAPIQQATTESGLFVEVTLTNHKSWNIPLVHLQPLPSDVIPLLEVSGYRSWCYEKHEKSNAVPTFRAFVRLLLTTWFLMGMTIGATLATHEEVPLAIKIGAVICALLGAVAGVFSELDYRRAHGHDRGMMSGVIVGDCSAASLERRWAAWSSAGSSLCLEPLPATCWRRFSLGSAGGV